MIAGNLSFRDFPNTVVWAWQHSEDLRRLDSRKYGIAYMACRVTVDKRGVRIKWREQPLRVGADAKLMPVVRIDVEAGSGANLSVDTARRIAAAVLRVSAYRQTCAVQIDFDARQDERDFYRILLGFVAKSVGVPVSITALASWCLFDDWTGDLPVAERVPMMFSLGDERQKILQYFRQHNEFRLPECCSSLGISLEDAEVNELMIPLMKQRKIPSRVYVFSRTAWTDVKIQAVSKLLGSR